MLKTKKKKDGSKASNLCISITWQFRTYAKKKAAEKNEIYVSYVNNNIFLQLT